MAKYRNIVFKIYYLCIIDLAAYATKPRLHALSHQQAFAGDSQPSAPALSSHGSVVTI